MSDLFIVNGLVYLDRQFQPKTIHVRDGKLHLLEPEEAVTGGVYGAAGQRIVPGFIDIHTHGAVGVDVNGASAEDLEKIGQFFAGNGTTAWLASVLTDAEEQTRSAISQCLVYQSRDSLGAQLLGIHLEGPFLASQYKGPCRKACSGRAIRRCWPPIRSWPGEISGISPWRLRLRACWT